jgi:large conductance mechanosensitive channel
MLAEFRQFISRGNVLDLAIAVIIGAAFAAIVSSLTDDVIMPILGQVTGGLDFSSYFVRLGPVPDGYAGSPTDYAALKKAGAPLLGYGAFLTAIIKFLILAFVIFLLIKAANRATGSRIGEPAATAEDTLLLREIRDALRARGPVQ